MKRNNFSLIELLVVMAIIGILAGMIAPALQAAYEKKKAAEIQKKADQRRENKKRGITPVVETPVQNVQVENQKVERQEVKSNTYKQLTGGTTEGGNMAALIRLMIPIIIIFGIGIIIKRVFFKKDESSTKPKTKAKRK